MPLKNKQSNKKKGKLLLLIGGIADQAYACEEILDSQFDLSTYSNIVQFDYEKILDSRYKWFPIYKYMRRLDRHSDWWQFNFYGKVRERIRASLKGTINAYKKHYKEIDLVTHSLGAWIALGTDVKVNSMIMTGSPLNAKSRLMRWRVRSELNKRIKNRRIIKAKNIAYLWNKGDYISGRIPDPLRLMPFTEELEILEIGKGHGLKEYLNAYQNYVVDNSNREGR